MKLYHCVETEYYNAQVQQDGSFVPHDGALWCCDHAKGTLEATCGSVDGPIIEIDAQHFEHEEEFWEDYDEDELAELWEAWGHVYILYADNIPADKWRTVEIEEA